MTIYEYAEECYGDNGKVTVGTLDISWAPSSVGETVKAGEQLSLTLSWSLTSPATYKYTTQAEKMFDKFEVASIGITLPDGVEIPSGLTPNDLPNVYEYYNFPLGSNSWRFIVQLNDVAEGKNSTVTVPLKVLGNGEKGVGEILDFGELNATMVVEFTVIDRTTGQDVKEYIKYIYPDKSEGKNDLGSKKTATDDKWGIEKQNPTVTVSQDGETVTLEYPLMVGLESTTGSIIRDKNSYNRVGRVPFVGDVTLTEIPTVYDRDGDPLTPNSVTVTPQFDNLTPIDVPVGGGSVTLPVDTCAGQGLTDVADTAPYLSDYVVKVVYDYDEFIANYYDANQNKLTVSNTATLNYQLKGLEPATDSSTVETQVGEVTQPAAINIQKYIVEAAGSTANLYNSTGFGQSGEPISGPATFEIYNRDGATAATIYIKQADGTYKKLNSNTVTIDPADTENENNSTTGEITVYLDPGTYVVSETKGPEHTFKMTDDNMNADDKIVTVAAAGEPGIAQFYDKEQLGSITVTKIGKIPGENDQNLAGAEIGLYDNSDKLLEKKTSDSNGNINFTRLPYEEYYLKEIKAPESYIIDTKAYQVTLSESNISETVTITNNANQAPVKLIKYMFNGAAQVQVGSENYREFAEAFSLEKKVGNEWQPVTTHQNLSISENGEYATSLPVYDEYGTAITYRFVETLPEGWHKPSGHSAEGEPDGKMYSVEFDLAGLEGKPISEAKKIIMYNERNGSIELTKQFWQVNSDGQLGTVSNQSATFTLYRMIGGGTPGAVAGYIDVQTDADGKISFTDLERQDGNGNAYLYFLVETSSPDGYTAGKTQSGNNTANLTISNITLNGEQVDAWGPFDFTSTDGTTAAKLSQTITVKNYRQELPVTVYKQDSVTGAFVNGASFEIYEYDKNIKGTKVIASTDITSANGVTVYLEQGHKYIVVESSTPTGYNLEEITVGGKKTDVIDLTTTQEVGDVKTYTTVTVTLKNQPDPQLKVNKTLEGNYATPETLTGVKFEIYTMAGNGSTFNRVMDYDGTEATLTSGTAKQLPAGTYYLKEIVQDGNPKGILDPSTFDDLYTGKGVVGDDGDFYFGPFILNEVSDTDSLVTTENIVNYSQLGAVMVTKYTKDTDGKEKVLTGAGNTIVISIYTKDENGELVPQGNPQTIGADGTTVFSGLPIYDDEGKLITYYIKETQAPNGYTGSDEVLTVTLTPGVTVGANGNDELKFVNLPKLEFQVTKVFYNIWEHNFTDKEYYLRGAQIALYEKTVGEDGIVVYELLQTKTTDDLGQVLFENLDQKKEYVAVEFSIPAEDAYKYLEPEKTGTDYLVNVKDEDGQPPQTLTETDLEKCYYVTKAALQVNEKPVALFPDKLTNVEHWTQLNILKFMMVTDEVDPDNPTKTPVNNAQFDLYMEILSDSTQQDAALTFDSNNTDKYTYIGSYYSGTMYDADGKRMDGWFATDILKAADNVVYWLVERTPGIGAVIKPENQITLIKADNVNYTNNSTSIEGSAVSCTKVISYTKDAVTKGEVENNPTKGPGEDMFSTVRIAKWAGSLNEDGQQSYDSYTPLGNATFQLWLVHKNGTKVAPLDTLTTGLDNNLTDGVTGELTAWASSKEFSFKGLTEEYNEYYDETGVNKDLIWKDDSGNGYVRVQLVEVSTPGGYNTPTGGFNMIMFFQAPTDGKYTETFNDAYYVKGKDTQETLAENQGEVWALYPVSADGQEITEGVEDATGQYRIVNWPTDHFAVTVTKYGYEVNAYTENKTSEELDAWFQTNNGRTPISVTMELQRYSPTEGGWKNYAYNGSTASFTTDAATGSFTFPNGLPVGRYRIIETGANSGYQNIYDGSASGLTDDTFHNFKAYYFTVTNSNLDLSLYNPDKLSIQLRKTDTNDTDLSGATFELNGTLSSTKGADGIYTIDNIGSGVYVLSETAAPNGYSKAYLKEYLASAYAANKKVSVDGKEYSLADFATGGIWLGFVTEQRGNDVVVTDVVDLSDYGVDDLALKIENPALSSVKIIKTDNLTEVGLEGAEFTVEYKAFTGWSGTETITDDGTGWTPIGSRHTTGTYGSVTVQNLEPGIYKITEVVAPDGYDLTGGPIYVVLTGGMNKTVAVTGDVTVINNPDEGGVVFANPQQVELTVEKVVNSGQLTVNEDHVFSFTLYSDPDMAEAYKVGTATVNVTKGAEDGAKFYSSSITGLSQGETYYLLEEEACIGKHFALTSVSALTGDSTLNIEKATSTDGSNTTLYKFTVPSNSAAAITVTAENTYLYGEVTILKVDGKNGEPLEGAAFGAYLKRNDQYMTNVIGEWTEKSDGEYTVRLPLTDVNGNTFKIQELNAPPGYVLEYPYTEVTVKPGEIVKHGDYDAKSMGTTDRATNDAAMLKELIFPNYKGTVINITKYAGTKESGTTSTLAGATFTLYVEENGSWNYVSDYTTQADGRARFTVQSGNVYAIAETAWPTGDYQGLEGIYDGDTRLTTEQGKNATLNVVNNGVPVTTEQELEYKAYNIPWLNLEIRKTDAADSSTNPAPAATVNIYEVPDDTSATLTMAQVQALMLDSNIVLEKVDVSNQGSEGTYHYSYTNPEKLPALGNKIVGGKTYLIVETNSSYPQVRDNENVVWYAVLSVPLEAHDTQIVTLKNLKPEAKHTLSKTTETENYTSLMSKEATLNYTITPEVTNSYPLTGFTLKDEGLTAYTTGTDGQDESLPFDEYLKDNYSITQVTVDQVSHKTDAYADGSFPVLAKVTFYDFEGNPIRQHTQEVSGAPYTFMLNAGEKAKRVEVEYYSPEFSKATGYALGQNFIPGNVKIQIELDQQEGGQNVKAITKVTNSAETVMEWKPWSSDGILQGPQTETMTATASNNFGELPTALVSVTKTVDTNYVNLGGTEGSNVATYTITVSNSKDATAPMQKPFLVDLLPQGTVLHGENGNLTIVSAPDGIKLENQRSETYMGENAFFILLQGELQPGESITLTLQVELTSSVVLYGADVWNNVIVGSRVQGVQTAENKRATSWKTEQGHWPNDIDTALDALDKTRVKALKTMLDDMAGFGYITASVTLTWHSNSDATLLKTGRGDRSYAQGQDFSSTLLSTVNNENGSVDYQLIFSNLSEAYNFTDATLLDILPFVGDENGAGADRHSEWGMFFNSITSVYKVKNDGSTEPIADENYRLFSYTNPIDSSNINDVYDQVENLKFDSTSLPDGWQDGADSNAKAIAVAIEKDVAIALAPGESYVVEFKMDVQELSMTELMNRSWTNTVNNFNCHYSQYMTDISAAAYQRTLVSNQVSATILPEQVKVGGHVWIDKDADGVWDDDESVSVDDLANNEMVQKLLSVIEIRLYKFSGTSTSISSTTSYDKSSDDEWYDDANFVFDGLDPAEKLDTATDNQLYDTSQEKTRMLNPAYLKGTAPASYIIAATIPEEGGVLTEVTSLGETTGRSRTQTELEGTYIGEQKDNNFAKSSDTTSSSERFYLHPVDPTVWFDNTKDIGLVLQRNLVINKQAAGDPQTKVQGAVFDLYGPFATVDEANAATLNASKLLRTVTTDQNGEADFGNINWFQVYVIVERQAGDGYKLDGASAANNDGVLSNYKGNSTTNPAWVLDVPANDVDNAVQKVTVQNKIDVQYTIEAAKSLQGKTLAAEQFEFELLDKSEQFIENAKNDDQGKVSFTPISANKEGTFTYYIREVIPATPANGYSYDNSLYKAEVTVTWDAVTANFTASVSYFVRAADGSWTAAPGGAEFVNEYEPSPTVYAPQVEKTFAADSQQPAAGDSFQFELAFDSGDKDSVVMPAATTVTVTGAGTASFGNITFKSAGTYTFTIKEKADAALEDFGYTFDATEWTLTVKVVDNDGVLSVQDHNYRANGKTDSTIQATFENSYKAVECKYAPAVKKTLTGDTPPADETFSFTLALASAEPAGGAILPANTTVNVVGAGSARFGDITFRAAGTYTFTITEVKGNTPGYTYDDSVWTLTVKTKLEGSDLVLDGTPVYKSDKQTAASANPEAEFVNEFENFVEYAPAVFKSFSVDSDPRPSAVTFSFTMAPNANYPDVEMPASTTATVTGYGKGYFDAIKFTEPGTYLFTITEVNGKASGYSYDTAKWTLSVTVTEDAVGQLSVTAVSYAKQGTNIVLTDYASFVNSFDKEKVPKTGDSSNLPGYTAALLGSAGALAILEFIRRKLRRGEI